ncbi:hypothetical protein [uncultured Arcobacter sp.]|nr:hypothetical protein [uncultured Arcobacter sp.]
MEGVYYYYVYENNMGKAGGITVAYNQRGFVQNCHEEWNNKYRKVKVGE